MRSSFPGQVAEWGDLLADTFALASAAACARRARLTSGKFVGEFSVESHGSGARWIARLRKRK